MKKSVVALAVAGLAVSSSQFNYGLSLRLAESKPPKPRMNKQAIYKKGKK